MGNVPAPATSLPFVDGRGFLTPSAVQFLQPLYTAVQGLAGPLGDDNAISGPYLLRLRGISPSMVSWTPTLAGSSTAGAQTYGTAWGAQIDIGPVRLALFSIVLTALDGATAGDVQVAGFPIPSNTGATLQAGWIGEFGGVTLTAGYTQLGLAVAPGVSVAGLVQSGSASAPLALPVAALSATSAVTGGVLFFR